MKKLLKLCIPAMIMHLMDILLLYVDTAMVGHCGMGATAAVGSTQTIWWFIEGVEGAVGFGVLVLVSKAYGKKDDKSLHEYISIGVRLSLMVSITMTIVLELISGVLPKLLGVESSICYDSSVYFSVTCSVLVLRLVGYTISNAFQGVEKMIIPLIIGTITNALNIFLDWLFIYCFDLGVFGAALATSLSSGLWGILFLILGIRYKLVLFGIKFNFDKLKEIIKLAIPLFSQTVLKYSAFIVESVLIIRLGTLSLATNTVVQTVEELFYTSFYGIQVGASALIGEAIGKKNNEEYLEIRHNTDKLLLINIGISIILWILSFKALLPLFNSDTKVINFGLKFYWFCIIELLPLGFQVVYAGVLTSFDKANIVAIIRGVCIWFLRILISYLGITFFGLGLEFVWAMSICDITVCGCIYYLVGRKLRVRNE